ncbi:MAG: hypothetical protein AABY18_09505 [Candidatus Thermoplasmatota archaeon]
MRFWRWVPFAANTVGMAAALFSIAPLTDALKVRQRRPAPSLLGFKSLMPSASSPSERG